MPVPDEKTLLKFSVSDLVQKERGLALMAINKINQICKAGFALHMIEDYETMVFRYEKIAKESRQEVEKLRFENQRLRKITENTEGERANLKIFNTFESEYKVIVDEILNEVRKRDDAIENLTRKQQDTEQRYREYRFVFGNIAQVEEKLKKMEVTYTDKLKSCFDHYSKTMTGVTNEAEQLKLLSNRLKHNEISPSKASDILSELVKGLETQINYFEKFFNKFKNVSDIQAVVKDYLDGKQEIRKGINKVIYLQEMAKFKENQSKPSLVEELKRKHYASIANMETRFKSFQQPDSENPELLRQSGLQNSFLDKSEERRVLQKQPGLDPKSDQGSGLSRPEVREARDSPAKGAPRDLGRNKAGVVKARPLVADRETRVEFTIKEHSVSSLVRAGERPNKTDRLPKTSSGAGPRFAKTQSQASLFRTKASTQAAGSSGSLSRAPDKGRQGPDTPQDGGSRSQLVGAEGSRVSYLRTEPAPAATLAHEPSQYLSRVALPLNRPATAQLQQAADSKKASMASFMRKGALS